MKARLCIVHMCNVMYSICDDVLSTLTKTMYASIWSLLTPFLL
jgi:hypothetical protein